MTYIKRDQFCSVSILGKAKGTNLLSMQYQNVIGLKLLVDKNYSQEVQQIVNKTQVITGKKKGRGGRYQLYYKVVWIQQLIGSFYKLRQPYYCELLKIKNITNTEKTVTLDIHLKIILMLIYSFNILTPISKYIKFTSIQKCTFCRRL